MRLGEEGGGKEKRWGELGGGAYGWRGGSIAPLSRLSPLPSSPNLAQAASSVKPSQPSSAQNGPSL